MRGPKGETSPPGTGWMKRGPPTIGAAMRLGRRRHQADRREHEEAAADGVVNAESTGAAASVGEPVTDAGQLLAGLADDGDGVLDGGRDAGGEHDGAVAASGVCCPRGRAAGRRGAA